VRLRYLAEAGEGAVPRTDRRTRRSPPSQRIGRSNLDELGGALPDLLRVQRPTIGARGTISLCDQSAASLKVYAKRRGLIGRQMHLRSVLEQRAIHVTTRPIERFAHPPCTFIH
jgi:hypothetical protein